MSTELTLPARVLLRCKLTAVITDRQHGIACEFEYYGKRDDNGKGELWRSDGKWRENGRPHPLDIVGVEQGAGFNPFTG